MRLTKRGPYYWVDYRDPSGARKRESLNILATPENEAAAYAAAGEKVKAAMVAPKPEPASGVVGPRMSLGAALDLRYEEHWARQRQASVIRHQLNKLQREVGDMRLCDVTREGLQAKCEEWLRDGTAPGTVNRRMTAVGVVLQWAVDKKLIPSRPRLPKYDEDNIVDRYMSPMEEQNVLGWLVRRSMALDVEQRAAEADEYRYVHQLATFLIDTGFRFSEAFKFRVDGNLAVLGEGKAQSKSGKGRAVPMTTRAREAAVALATSPVHARLRAMPIRKVWDWVTHRWKLATREFCPDVTLHILRHTCASRLVQRGIPIYTVSKWLGHSSVKVTERYAKLAPDTLAQALSALEGRPVAVEDVPSAEVTRAIQPLHQRK